MQALVVFYFENVFCSAVRLSIESFSAVLFLVSTIAGTAVVLCRRHAWGTNVIPSNFISSDEAFQDSVSTTLSYHCSRLQSFWKSLQVVRLCWWGVFVVLRPFDVRADSSANSWSATEVSLSTIDRTDSFH